ncbi:MAG: ribonuclease H-like domain-containing protein [Deltaproteobacteria bacterium]|nr:ribonuclease H-like domain-containing protein [Deltaproteobacteria bacterium]
MLEHTFIHVQGIGQKTERNLRQRGILTWEDFLVRGEGIFPSARDRFIRGQLEDSVRHREDPVFFRDRLPSSEHWRLYEAFRERAVFLDIETGGGDQGLEEITLIGIYDGREFRSFLNGRDLADFETAIAQYDLVITFNGTSFDLPMIRRFFPNIALPAVHIDLRFVLRRLGYRGGLKKIEKDLGVLRESSIEGMNGLDAVRLWNAYRWGDRSALDLLIRYNEADVLNLKPLMEMASREARERLFHQAC